MLHVVAFLTTKPGQRDAFLREFHAVMPKVHAEHGCIQYEPATDADGPEGLQTPIGPDSVIVVEKWADMDALKAHAAAPHMAEYAARVKDMLVHRAVHVLTPA